MWTSYFETSRDLALAAGTFKLYETGQGQGPTFIFHHGGGHSALSWALTAKHLVERLPCKVICYDCRGHGLTVTNDDYNLSLDQLSEDLRLIIESIRTGDQHKEIVLVGHSMGGSVVVHTTHSG